MGAGVDEDKGASEAVAAVAVVEKRICRAQADAADVVHAERGDALFFVDGFDVHLVTELLHDRLGLLAGVAEEVFATVFHGFLGKPADHGLDILRGFGRVVGFDDHIAARDVDLVLERHDHRLRRKRLGDFFAAGEVDFFDAGGKAAGKDAHGIAGLEHTTCDAARVTAKVVKFLGERADDPLDWEASIHMIRGAAGVNGLQVVEQR